MPPAKNIYVELISPEGSIPIRQMLLAQGGFAPGDFDTSDTLAARQRPMDLAMSPRGLSGSCSIIIGGHP